MKKIDNQSVYTSFSWGSTHEGLAGEKGLTINSKRCNHSIVLSEESFFFTAKLNKDLTFNSKWQFVCVKNRLSSTEIWTGQNNIKKLFQNKIVGTLKSPDIWNPEIWSPILFWYVYIKEMYRVCQNFWKKILIYSIISCSLQTLASAKKSENLCLTNG